MSDIKPAVVLGCGPAGLLAAHALATLGAPFLIFSIKKKSEIYGAQYIQSPIPGVADIQQPDGYIRTILLGNKENYAKRVYGDPAEATSWPEFPPDPEPAWDLRRVYDALWDEYHGAIIDQEISSEDVFDMEARFPVVVSTIPKWRICTDAGSHDFRSMNIYVRHVMEYTGLPDFFDREDNVVIYNGTDKGEWYRTAQIFGHQSTEYVYHPGIERALPNGWSGYKVLGNSCDCHPNITFTGRLGTWRRGILTHMAFSAAVEAYQERMAV